MTVNKQQPTLGNLEIHRVGESKMWYTSCGKECSAEVLSSTIALPYLYKNERSIYGVSHLRLGKSRPALKTSPNTIEYYQT